MDIAKLGDYFEARKYLHEGMEWAEKMLEEGFFDWHKDDIMPSGLPCVFIACEGTDSEDVTKLKNLIDLSVAFSQAGAEFHKAVKGHHPKWVDIPKADGSEGTDKECSVCLEEHYVRELEIKFDSVWDADGITTTMRLGQDMTHKRSGSGHWENEFTGETPWAERIREGYETNEFDHD